MQWLDRGMRRLPDVVKPEKGDAGSKPQAENVRQGLRRY